MNSLLLFFAFPIATIILSITAQKLIKSPILVASVFWAIYVIVAFAAFDAVFLIYGTVYSVFAYITAYMTQMLLDYLKEKKEAQTQSVNAINHIVNTNCSGRQNSMCCGRYRRFR